MLKFNLITLGFMYIVLMIFHMETSSKLIYEKITRMNSAVYGRPLLIKKDESSFHLVHC